VGTQLVVSVGQQDVDTLLVVDEVLRAFRRRLGVVNSPLLRDTRVAGEISEQVRSIVHDVLGLAGARETEDALRGQLLSLARLRPGDVARRGIHPAMSFQAADTLFHVALPIIVRHCRLEGLEILYLSQRLHQAIMNRIARASLPYVEFLQTGLHASRKSERHRISRELHDRVGHGMALALQHFDMHRYFSGTDNARAEREFTAGFTSLDEAFRTVRYLSTELRRAVGDDGIEAAIKAYLRDHVPGGIRACLQVTGDATVLPAPISEELYLVVREACRNALRHGRPSELRVALTVTDSEVTATVSDDGRGFSMEASDAGGGLPSMAERAELLNGTLKMESTIGEGTTVTVRVPLSGDGKQ
jgi:signal transduction histidine kinase